MDTYIGNPGLILAEALAASGMACWLSFDLFSSFFLFLSGWHTLSSHVSAEACLTGWPNAQPQGRD